jgi:hypothetical protein
MKPPNTLIVSPIDDRSFFFAIVTANRRRVDRIKFEEHVVAVVVARVAEEDVMSPRWLR